MCDDWDDDLFGPDNANEDSYIDADGAVVGGDTFVEVDESDGQAQQESSNILDRVFDDDDTPLPTMTVVNHDVAPDVRLITDQERRSSRSPSVSFAQDSNFRRPPRREQAPEELQAEHRRPPAREQKIDQQRPIPSFVSDNSKQKPRFTTKKRKFPVGGHKQRNNNAPRSNPPRGANWHKNKTPNVGQKRQARRSFNLKKPVQTLFVPYIVQTNQKTRTLTVQCTAPAVPVFIDEFKERGEWNVVFQLVAQVAYNNGFAEFASDPRFGTRFDGVHHCTFESDGIVPGISSLIHDIHALCSLQSLTVIGCAWTLCTKRPLATAPAMQSYIAFSRLTRAVKAKGIKLNLIVR